MEKTSKKYSKYYGKYRAECIRMMNELKPNLFVTFTFNRNISIIEAQVLLERFHGYIDRKIIGRAFIRRPEKRSSYIATIEKPRTNIHIHALFKMTAMQKLKFCLTADAEWKKLCQSGNLNMQNIRDAEGAADYITKEIRPQTSDQLLLSRNIKVASSR